MPHTLIISSRLPTQVVRSDEGFAFQPTEGGLATGLGAIHRSGDTQWVGWPGLVVEDQAEQKALTRQLQAGRMVPVFLTEAEVRDYDQGFSTETIWPTFHYFPQHAVYDDALWEAYVATNEKFCQAVLALAGPNDTIWVHDYQLLLLPELLRRARPQATIGFFLHIPFPSQELLRVLPWRTELLRGLLGADLIGFQTFGYVRHFLSAVSQLLGLTTQNGQVEMATRTVFVDTFPFGINYARYAQATGAEAVRRHVATYRQVLQGTRVVLSIDRLDYTKGLAQRLRAFELLLHCHPQWREQVCLLMVVVPSRAPGAQYAALKEEIDVLVGRINAQYRTLSWNPIHYFYRSFSFDELAALYQVAAVALVTPMRDGMNLVAKEFVASKTDQRGVLILSERAGAARELSEALIINPTSTREVVAALHEALTMPEEEQQQRLAQLQDLVRRYDVFEWTQLFRSRLAYAKQRQRTLATLPLDEPTRQQLVRDYTQAETRLLLLDYDGTLTSFHPNPQRARPDQALHELVRTLAEQARNQVVIISGRDRTTIEQWLGHLPVHLIAEHGVWLRPAGGEWSLFRELHAEWKREMRPVLEQYVRRTAGSFLEEKGFSLVWHYRRADPDLGQQRARELRSYLNFLVANTELQVLEGNKIVEIKHGSINKGAAASRWIESGQPGFILALGDDRTDEDTFRAMPPSAYTVKVGGASHSLARYHVPGVAGARDLLRHLL